MPIEENEIVSLLPPETQEMNKFGEPPRDPQETRLATKSTIENAIAEITPGLVEDMNAGDVEHMLEKAAPLAVLVKVDIMVNAKSDSTRDQAARDLLHMAGWKPVEKSINVFENIDRMSDKQMNSYLNNSLRKYSKAQREEIINLILAADGSYQPEKAIPITIEDIPVQVEAPNGKRTAKKAEPKKSGVLDDIDESVF